MRPTTVCCLHSSRQGTDDADRLLAWEVARLRSLKSLEFTFAREDIHWVVRTLVNNGSRVLETVSFNYLSIDQSPETVKNQLTEQVIDGILRASPFASVSRVVIKLFANDPSNDGERWSRAVQAALPRTHELKMLHVSVHQCMSCACDRHSLGANTDHRCGGRVECGLVKAPATYTQTYHRICELPIVIVCTQNK